MMDEDQFYQMQMSDTPEDTYNLSEDSIDAMAEKYSDRQLMTDGGVYEEDQANGGCGEGTIADVDHESPLDGIGSLFESRKDSTGPRR